MTKASKELQEVAKLYAGYFDTLSPTTIDNVQPLISDDIHFIDPFNDVRGRDCYRRIVEKMFEDVRAPKFEILDLAWSGDLCFMRWDFSCNIAVIGDWSVRGMTEIGFNSDGLICSHYDYWDSGRHFYGRIPVVGSLLRFITRKARI